MPAKKAPEKKAAGKMKVKKETLRDLTATKPAGVKGGGMTSPRGFRPK
jgi:hypothetical protein